MSLFRHTSVVGGMTLLSRILGLVRDVVFARFVGAGLFMDAFIVAFKIPNFFRRMFGEGAFSQAFVPVISEYRSTREHHEVQALADRVAGTLGGILALLTLIGVIAAPLFVLAFAPGFLDDGDKFRMTADMLRLTFPYLLMISMVALAGGILNTYERFGVPAFTPVLLNVCLITAAALFAPQATNPGEVLAAGVLVAGLAQLLFQLPFLSSIRLLPRPRWDWGHQGVKRVFRLMLPALFGASVAQLNLLLDTVIASLIPEDGPVSWLYYSDRLMEFPLGVFAIALGTVILPGLSRHHAQQEREQFSATLDWALRLAVVFGLPAAVGLAVLAFPAVTTLFRYGAFTGEHALMASYSLTAYSFGLLGFTLVKILAPGYFSRQDTRTPVKVGIIAMATNAVLNVSFVVPMIVFGLTAPHAGLALATSIAAFVNAGLLLRGLLREGVYRPGEGWGPLAVRVLLGNALMAGVLVWALRPQAEWLAAGALDRGLWLGALIGGGILVYVLSLAAMGLRPRHLRMQAGSGTV